MNLYNKRAKELASQDRVFATIYFSTNPLAILEELEKTEWLKLNEELTTNGWLQAAEDCKSGKCFSLDKYSSDSAVRLDIEKVQLYFQRFLKYRMTLSSSSEGPFSDYLNGISVEDFRVLMQNLRGMDAAREIQHLYKEGILANDLGGSQLHRYMKELNLSYLPTVSKLNEARRGEISRKRYNMEESRGRDEKFLRSNRDSKVKPD